MQNEIIVNATPGETRVAVLERGVFAELHIERASERGVIGNVVKGRVTRVLPGMQASFVDIGLEKAAFLYAGDYIADAEGDEEDDDEAPRVRRRRRNGNGPRIEAMLGEGQEVVVQVAKEPIGTKGARITSHVSIPGRHLVLTPWSARVGVSRRIESDRERRRLRDMVERLRRQNLGFIIRTAGESISEADLEADVRYLTETWDEILHQKDRTRAPSVLYREPALPMRVIRDVAGAETRRIVIDSPQLYAEMSRFVERFMVNPPRVEHYTGSEPIFDQFGLEPQIDHNLGRKVWLKSGGYLIIDESEALTAIDVNTGRYVGKRDLEETVLKTNFEAVREVVHQLRFRNIGGLIIIDLIDMEDTGNRDKVYRALQEALRQDKARTNILKISELGLVEMTRKRTRESLTRTLCEPCPHCEGKSRVLSAESVAFKVLREIRKDLPRLSGRRVAVTVSPRVGEILAGAERASLTALEQELGRTIEVRPRADLHPEQFALHAAEPGPPVAFVPRWLASAASAAPAIDEEEDDLEDEEEDLPAAEPAALAGTDLGGDGKDPDDLAGEAEELDAAEESRILPPPIEPEEA